MAFFLIRSEVGVRFLLICWSRSLVSSFKIETKYDTRVNCEFDVTNWFPKVQWRSRGASGGTRPEAQALGAHQYTFCSLLKTRFKQKFRLKYA